MAGFTKGVDQVIHVFDEGMKAGVVELSGYVGRFAFVFG